MREKQIVSTYLEDYSDEIKPSLYQQLQVFVTTNNYNECLLCQKFLPKNQTAFKLPASNARTHYEWRKAAKLPRSFVIRMHHCICIKHFKSRHIKRSNIYGSRVSDQQLQEPSPNRMTKYSQRKLILKT